MNVTEIQSAIATLRANEATSKDLINVLAFACMDRIHEHHDVDSASRFLVALSPLNQRKVTGFFEKFSGHRIEEGVVGKRKKPRTVDNEEIDGYVVSLDAWKSFKESGLNFWQWATMSKKKEGSEINIEQVAKAAKRARTLAKEAKEKGILSDAQLFEQLTGGVFSADDMLLILQSMIKVDEEATKEAHDKANGVTLQVVKPTAELALA